jgi:poly(3-hydroxybutyrate) depolymerase
MLLNHLLGNLQSPVAPLRENLLSFDQSAFFDAHEESVSLADRGYIYIPDQCAEAECHLHLAFHGCDQNVATVGDDFVWDAGYNGWAEANRIVVLYPQTVRWTRALDPTGFTANPRGCWDWWGYSGDDFATREAPQMRAVRRMVEALGVPR